MDNIVFTRNFTLSEMLRSSSAERNNFTEQYEPPQEVINSLKDLSIYLLQPIREELGKAITISSGYRCPRVNQAEKGSATSQHVEGKASDTEYWDNGQNFNIKIAKAVILKKLPFDQMIIEFGESISKPAWIHLSYDHHRLRGDILRATKVLKEGTTDQYETKYTRLKPVDILNA
jgi:zinc D-Ala-D-Ala carboxypeptidase